MKAKKYFAVGLFCFFALVILFLSAISFSYLNLFYLAPSFWPVHLFFILIWLLNLFLLPGVRAKHKALRERFFACYLILSYIFSSFMAIAVLALWGHFVLVLADVGSAVKTVLDDFWYLFPPIFGAPLLILFFTGIVLKIKQFLNTIDNLAF